MARPREFSEIDAVRLASRAFWTRGYQATSIRDLEQATGLTAGSLYKAYGSKRELFLLCLEQYMKEESYLAILMKMFEKTLEESLGKIFEVIIESAGERSKRPAGCLVTNLVAELMNVDLELGEDAAAGLQEMQKALRIRVKWAQESGEIAADRDSSALGSYLMVLIQGMLVISTSTRDVAAMCAARDMAMGTLQAARPA